MQSSFDSGGDWQIGRFGVADFMAANRSVLSRSDVGYDTIEAENGIGNSTMLVPPPSFSAVHNPGNWAHKFGHALGLTHAPDGSGSIMSYGKGRAVLGRDLYNLSGGYR